METWLIDKTSARCDLKTKSSQLSKCKPVRFEFVLPPFLHAKVRHIHFTIFAIVLLRHMEGSATQPHCSNTAMCLGALARRFCCKHRPTRLPCPCLHGGTVLCVPWLPMVVHSVVSSFRARGRELSEMSWNELAHEWWITAWDSDKSSLNWAFPSHPSHGLEGVAESPRSFSGGFQKTNSFRRCGLASGSLS